MNFVALTPDEFHLAGFYLKVAEVCAGSEFLQNVLFVVRKNQTVQLDFSRKVGERTRIVNSQCE